jgi:exodeoxyribonuclease V alpha subunit
MKQIKLNPYILAEELAGIGFLTADKLGLRLGISLNNPVRIKHGILYAIRQVESSGDCACAERNLVMLSCQLLKVNDNYIKDGIDNLCQQGRLVAIIHDKVTYYQLDSMYNAEERIAENLIHFRNQSCVPFKVLAKHTHNLSKSQQNAINLVANSNVAIITGGPGTGKTHIIKKILEVCAYNELQASKKALSNKFRDKSTTYVGRSAIALVAPTGKAARRMEESTGYSSSTIHRALGYNGKIFTAFIGSAVIIVDEFSMVDTRLFSMLLSKIKHLNPRIYLVGDSDQLPSVGPGNVLADLITSEQFPVIKLTEIYRQSKESQIIMGAHDINQGVKPRLFGADLVMFTLQSAQNIADYMVETTKELLSNHEDVGLHDVQVLSPMKNGVCGTVELNKRLQALLNPNSTHKNKLGIYRCDRVMYTRNNYDIGIMNGMVGVVRVIEWVKSRKHFNEILEKLYGRLAQFNDYTGNYDDVIGTVYGRQANELSWPNYVVGILFDEHKGQKYDDLAHGQEPLTYITGDDLNYLALAYAITIHKSQGSEYQYVIMPVTSAHYIMLNRNLTYTGLTRAKKVAFMFIDDNGMTRAISTRRANRVTFLVDKIKALSNE